MKRKVNVRVSGKQPPHGDRPKRSDARLQAFAPIAFIHVMRRYAVPASGGDCLLYSEGRVGSLGAGQACHA